MTDQGRSPRRDAWTPERRASAQLERHVRPRRLNPGADPPTRPPRPLTQDELLKQYVRGRLSSKQDLLAPDPEALVTGHLTSAEREAISTALGPHGHR